MGVPSLIQRSILFREAVLGDGYRAVSLLTPPPSPAVRGTPVTSVRGLRGGKCDHLVSFLATPAELYCPQGPTPEVLGPFNAQINMKS